jgi:putative flippase GtrA
MPKILTINLIKITFLKYIISGVIVNSFGFGLYAFVVQFTHPLLTLCVCYPIIILVHYTIHKKFTFSNRQTIFSLYHVIQFSSTYLISFLINFSSIYTFHNFLGYNHFIVQLTNIICTSLIFFLYNNFYLFKNKSSIDQF